MAWHWDLVVVMLVAEGFGLLASFGGFLNLFQTLAGIRWALWPLFTVDLET